MELCKKWVESLSHESVKDLVRSAPSVPTGLPNHREPDIITRSETIQSQDQILELRSLSAQTTFDVSQDISNSSCAPSRTESTSASSLSELGSIALQESSASCASSYQPRGGLTNDRVHVISTQTHDNQPSWRHGISRELIEQSKFINHILQDQADIHGLVQLKRESHKLVQSPPESAGRKYHDAPQSNPAVTPDKGDQPQAYVARATPKTEALQSQGATLQLKPKRTPKFIQVSRGKHPLFRYRQTAYISPTMPMKQDVVDHWESEVKKRLEDAILQTIHDTKSGDSGLTIECQMAGKTESNLKPTIVVACDTECLRRALVKQIKTFVWIPESKLECMVIHTPTSTLAGTTSGLSAGAIVAIVFSSTGAFFFLGLIRLWYFIRHRGRGNSVASRNLHQPIVHRAEEGNLQAGASKELTSTRYENTNKSTFTPMPNSNVASTYTVSLADGISKIPNNRHPPSADQAITSPICRASELTNNQRKGLANFRSELNIEGLTKLCDINFAPQKEGTLCAGILKMIASGYDPRMSTLGGLIVIDKKVHGLTVAHALNFKHDVKNQQEESRNPTADCEEHLRDDDLSSTIVEFESEMSEPQEKVREEERMGDEEYEKPLEPELGISDVGQRLRWESMDSKFVTFSTTRSDWAVFEVGDMKLHLPNQINDVEMEQPVTLDSVCQKPDATAGEVIVAAGVSGLRQGDLGQCSASLWHQGSFLNVRQITLDNPLQNGDSGSWVTRGSQVCGHIVAAKDSLPWAYMLPMYQICDDIKAQFKAFDVSIMAGTSFTTKSAKAPSQQPLSEDAVWCKSLD